MSKHKHCYVCNAEMELSSDGKVWICPDCGYREDVKEE